MTNVLTKAFSDCELLHSFDIRHSTFDIMSMPDPAPKAELLRSLGRLVRGLSALFWGLPISFIVCFYTGKAEALRNFGIVPPLVTTGLLVFGLWQLGDFQKQERVWRAALDRATLLS